MSISLLIVNADDFGLSRGVNEGIIEAHLQGIVTSASLMVKQPAAAEAATVALTHPSLDVGLHLDVGEWRLDGNDWVALYERVPGSDAASLKREVDEQLELFRQLYKSAPTHIDSHQHAHRREPLRSIVMEIGRREAVPVRHFAPTVRYLGDFFGRDEEGRPLVERLTPAWLTSLVNRLEPGLSELCCHPASFVDFDSDYNHERIKELHALCAPDVRAAIRERGVLLQSFRSSTHGRAGTVTQ